MGQDIRDNYSRKPDEISVLKIVVGLREYLKLLLSQWYWIFICASAFAAYNFYNYYGLRVTYPAKVGLLVKTNNTYKENSNVIKVFSRIAYSRDLIKEVLLTPTILENEEDLLINHYLYYYRSIEPDFLMEEVGQNFFFSTYEYEKFSEEEEHIFSFLLNRITKPSSVLGSDGFVTVSADDKLGFINLNISSPVENLSIEFVEVWKNIVIERYLEYTMFTPKGTYDNLKGLTDSLSRKFQKKYYRLQKLKSKYLKLVKEEENLNKKENFKSQGRKIKYLEKKINALDVEVEIVKADYLATLEKLKESEKDLTDQVPLITVTEQSTSPIKAFKASPIVAAIKGGIIGTILSVVIILALRVYRNIVNEALALEAQLKD